MVHFDPIIEKSFQNEIQENLEAFKATNEQAERELEKWDDSQVCFIFKEYLHRKKWKNLETNIVTTCNQVL